MRLNRKASRWNRESRLNRELHYKTLFENRAFELSKPPSDALGTLPEHGRNTLFLFGVPCCDQISFFIFFYLFYLFLSCFIFGLSIYLLLTKLHHTQKQHKSNSYVPSNHLYLKHKHDTYMLRQIYVRIADISCYQCFITDDEMYLGQGDISVFRKV